MSFSPRLRAILQALLVTFLWSSSWVLIKIALADIPPLTFAGLRYTMAVIILLPALWKQRAAVRDLSGKDWRNLGALGLVFYTLTQGGQFLTLKHLEAVTFSLLLNFTTVLVVLFGALTLAEYPSRRQLGGFILFITGVLVYFYPVFAPHGRALGLALAAMTVCANAAAAVLGRSINRQGAIPPLVVTVISMGIGALILLATGLTIQGLPPIQLSSWGIVVWLALVNTALAFTLWNITLRTLSAMESSIINNTMLIQIALLAWIFLGERLDLRDVAGLLMVAFGVLIIQLTGGSKGRAKQVGKANS
jgi:drug/metabolite transporter (DMT)-like permease